MRLVLILFSLVHAFLPMFKCTHVQDVVFIDEMYKL